jgi:hypothetical protein
MRSNLCAPLGPSFRRRGGRLNDPGLFINARPIKCLTWLYVSRMRIGKGPDPFFDSTTFFAVDIMCMNSCFVEDEENFASL